MTSNKSNIYSFIFHDIIKQPSIVLLLIITLIISILPFFSVLTHSENGLSILILFNKLNLPVASNGNIWLTYYAWVNASIFVLVLPQHFIETINKNRISLILSKSISRNFFLLQELFGIFLVASFCSLFNLLLFISILINFGMISYVIIFFSIVLPFIIVMIYLVVMYLSAITNSYGLTIILLFLHLLIFSPLLSNKVYFMSLFGNSVFVNYLLNILNSVLPQFYNLLNFSVLSHALNLNFILSLFLTIISFLPVALLLFFHIRRREFWIL